MKKEAVIGVVGPTGSGKTALGVSLASRFNGVILSADSRQVYRGLDIGTNKEGAPGNWEKEPARYINEIPQLLIDIVSPGERFTLADWLKEARRLIRKVVEREKLPIIVGGTGLYVSSLLAGFNPEPEDMSLRLQLEEDPLPVLQEKASRRGILLNQSDWSNRARLIRALARTNDTQSRNLTAIDEYLLIQPRVSREELVSRAKEWVERNALAIVEETRQLLDEGVKKEWLESLGLDYRLAVECIYHESSMEEFVSKLKATERQYIRRQETWWRHHQPVKLATDGQEAIRLVGNFLGKPSE